MDFQPWVLLAMMAAFALGWMAARVDLRALLSESRSLPRSYFKGLNFLLSEQPDRAVDAFIEVVQLDPETIELHFALGSLFRRRGETERAIRMHQNLLNRPDLPEDQRMHAMFELGIDYQKAGLLDRAEESFRRLEGSTYAIDAERHLLEIFEIEKEWVQAIAVAEKLQTAGTGSQQTRIAQFHCEIAQGAISDSRFDDAKLALQDALRVNRQNVRALIQLGDIAVQERHDEDAITSWKKVEQQNAPYVALIGERVVDAYTRVGRAEEGLRLLRSWLEVVPSIDLLETVVKAARAVEGSEAANEVARLEMHRNPSLLALGQFLDTRGALDLPRPEDRADLDVVRGLLANHTKRIGRYVCSQCGFKARNFYWQCPGCTNWETYPPRRTEELEPQRH
jgi:lipopolysaccharide biosynthesis regulator YciM